MQGEVLKFENGLVLEVVKDEFGTATKDRGYANGFRAHVRNANTCEQYDFNYYCGSAYKSSDDIEAKYIVESLLTSALDYENFEDVDEMAYEFGYTKISEAMEVWRGMEEEHDQMLRVCGDIDTISEALNEFYK